MLVAGLDIGSRTIALVEWDGERVARAEVTDTGTDPLANSQRLMHGRSYDYVVATGYGRDLIAGRALANEVITEIKAYAIGAHHMYSDVQTVLDVGGQDSKVIRVSDEGRAMRFEMNDRCAAGTGRFLENIARTLGLTVEEFGVHALAADGGIVQLSSMCTVFAESEVVSLIGRGEDSHRVAMAVHRAIVSRLAPMVRRVGLHERFVFAGGAAYNRCLQKLLAEELGVPITVPDNPQTVGALGAALHAAREGGGKRT
ncbi:MAG: acyl-CoA dehydratase activase [Anaerolineae bacterium]